MASRTILACLASVASTLTACATTQENPHYKHSTTYKGDSPYVNETTVPTSDYSSYTHPSSSVQVQNTARTISEPTPASYQHASYSTTTAAYNSSETVTATYTQLDHRCLQKEFNYGAGNSSIPCDPISIAIDPQSAIITPAYTPDTSYQTAQLAQPIYANSQTTTPSDAQQAPYTSAAMPDSYGTPGYQIMMQNNQPVAESEPLTPAPSAPMQPVMADANVAPQNDYYSNDYYSGPTLGENYHEVRQGDTVYSLSRSLCTSIENIQSINGLDQNFSIRLGDTIKLPNSEC